MRPRGRKRNRRERGIRAFRFRPVRRSRPLNRRKNSRSPAGGSRRRRPSPGKPCRGVAELGFAARMVASRCQSSPSGNEPANRRGIWGPDARRPRFRLRMEGGGSLGTCSPVLVPFFFYFIYLPPRTLHSACCVFHYFF